jgi:hypothetical protein
MAASARLMVLMSPEERASLNTKARTLGVSAGEVVRRAVQAFELGTEEEVAELRELVDVFNRIHPETLQIADECHRKVAEALVGPSRRDPRIRRRGKTATAQASMATRSGRSAKSSARRVCAHHRGRSGTDEPRGRRSSPARRDGGRRHGAFARGKPATRPPPPTRALRSMG